MKQKTITEINYESDTLTNSHGVPINSRNPHVDVLKGIGMILIFISHMVGLQEMVGYGFLAYIITTAVPLFFFINGYLFTPKSIKFPRYLVKRITGLWLPYTIFFVLSFLWTQTIYAYYMKMPLFGFTFDWGELVRAYLLAGKYLYDCPVVPSPLWFIHALFFASLLFYPITKIKSKGVLTAVAIALAVCSIPIQNVLSQTAVSSVWFLSLWPVALFFMTMGFLMRRIASDIDKMEGVSNQKPNKPPLLNSFLSLIALVIGFRLMQMGRGDMWDITSFYYFIGPLVSIGGIYLFARETVNRVFDFVGRNSLLFLGIHPWILQMPFIIDLPKLLEDRAYDGIVITIIYFIIAFLITSLIVFCVAFIRDRVWGIFKKKTA